MPPLVSQIQGLVFPRSMPTAVTVADIPRGIQPLVQHEILPANMLVGGTGAELLPHRPVTLGQRRGCRNLVEFALGLAYLLGESTMV